MAALSEEGLSFDWEEANAARSLSLNVSVDAEVPQMLELLEVLGRRHSARVSESHRGCGRRNLEE